MEEIFGDQIMSIKNPYLGRSLSPAKDYFNAGVKATVQYLEGECLNHTPPNAEVVMSDLLYFDVEAGVFRYKHRLDCPDCMAKVHEELGI